MKKLIYFSSIIFSLLFLLVSFLGISSFDTFATEANNSLIFRAYGDSISAGYGLEDYQNYVDGTSVIAYESYPQVFAQKYIDNLGGKVEGYGVSGDQTQDLVEDLAGYKDKSAQDYDEFYNTNYFSLCIGANNILTPAISSVSNYLSGSLSDENYRTILEQGVSQFVEDYNNAIIPCLTQNENSKVYVMTIYNPYKYISLNDIAVNTGNTMLDMGIKTTLTNYETKFTQMLAITMEYLQQINNEIRESASENVVVVDIYNLFESFTKQQYLEYINADASKINITSMNDIYNITSLFATYCDPHPTAKGHEVIAKQHIQKLAVLKLEIKTDLTTIKSDEDKISMELTQVGGESYEYKLTKKIDSNETIIKEDISLTINESFKGMSTFQIKAKDLAGKGKIYVQGLDGNAVLAKTNEVDFEYQSNSTPTKPTDPELPDPTVDEEKSWFEYEKDNFIILICLVVGFLGLMVAGIFVFKKHIK